MNAPAWAWCVLSGVLGALLAVDWAVGKHAGPGRRRAVGVSVAWIGAGVAFGAILRILAGADVASQYFAGYLLEKSLSVDNVFVFALIFTGLGIPALHQRRVLFYGVVGALVLRAAFIAGGAASLNRFGWMLNVFGVMLLVAGVRMVTGHGAGPRVSNPRVVKLASRIVPFADRGDGDRFWTRIDGRLAATPLVLALLAVESADIVFAADSIPAVFGVTREPFVVFSSNAFAVLGLRALYLVSAEALDRLSHVRYVLGALLGFVGAKTLADPWIHVPTAATLAVTAAAVGGAVAASLVRPPGRDHPLADGGPPALLPDRHQAVRGPGRMTTFPTAARSATDSRAATASDSG